MTRIYLADEFLDFVDQIIDLVDRFHRPELILERVSADGINLGHFGVRRGVLETLHHLQKFTGFDIAQS